MDDFNTEEGGNTDALVEAAEFDALMGLSIEEIMRVGQKALLVRLVGKARAHTASHQELAILRNILKDNGLTLGIPPAQPQEQQHAPLPEFGDPDYN